MQYLKGFILNVEGENIRIKLSDSVKLYKVLGIDEESDKGTYYIVVENEEYKVGEEEIKRAQELLKKSEMEFDIKKRYEITYIERYNSGFSHIPLILFNESEVFITEYEYISDDLRIDKPKFYELSYGNKKYEITESVFNFIKENIINKIKNE